MFTNTKLLGNHHFHPYNNCFLGVPGKWTLNPGWGSWFCFSPSKRNFRKRFQKIKGPKICGAFGGIFVLLLLEGKSTPQLGDPKLGLGCYLGCSRTPSIKKMQVYIPCRELTYISHLGKRKIIFKMLFLVDILVPWRVAFRDSCTHKKWRKENTLVAAVTRSIPNKTNGKWTIGWRGP